jgi:hypothetical protein
MAAVVLLTGCSITGTAFGAPAKGAAQPVAQPAATPGPDDSGYELSPPRADRPPLPRQPDSPDDRKGEINRIEALPKRIADPWEAVVNEQPRWRFGAAHERWGISMAEHVCTAAIDHCFVTDTWLVEWDEQRSQRTAFAAGIGESPGKFREPDDEASFLVVPARARSSMSSTKDRRAYTAYRTVPATKQNLVPGTLMFALSFEHKIPNSPLAVFDWSWIAGVVDRVDLDMGFVYIKGREDPLWLSSARVAVLSWRIGGKVQIIGTKKRGELAVSPKDVFLP